MQRNSLSKRFLTFTSPFMAPLLLLCASCSLPVTRVSQETIYLPQIHKLVVVGFRSAMHPWEKPGVTRSPLTGAVFMSEPVPQSVTNEMTTYLFNRLFKETTYDLISPAQARNVYKSLESSGSISNDMELSQKIGAAFSADAVLMGYVYRWRQRQGTDYAINSPASVAFDLCLIDPDRGTILWRGKFDKTQRSLSENLFDVDMFLKAGWRWMTAEKLAEMGLNDLLNKFPKGEPVGER